MYFVVNPFEKLHSFVESDLYVELLKHSKWKGGFVRIYSGIDAKRKTFSQRSSWEWKKGEDDSLLSRHFPLPSLNPSGGEQDVVGRQV